VLDGQDSRKTAEIKTEDGKKERHLLYYDGESVSGKVKKPEGLIGIVLHGINDYLHLWIGFR